MREIVSTDSKLRMKDKQQYKSFKVRKWNQVKSFKIGNFKFIQSMENQDI